MKYLKSFAIILVGALILTILSSLLSYNNIISEKVNDIIKLLGMFSFSFIGGIYIGNKSLKKGFLEGLKVGGATVLLFFLVSLLLKDKITIGKIIYYSIILFIVTIGSIVGINKKGKS